MASHTAQLQASGSRLPDLSSEQKQVKPFFVAPLHLLKCAKLQFYGYCGVAQSQW